jgi:hypothetical protein
MVSTLTILFASGLALFLVWTLLRSGRSQVRSLDDWEANKHEVNLDGFRLLLDPAEERYLRTSLTPAEFLVFQRRRLGLALQSLDLVGKNAMMLMRLGQLAKPKADAKLTREADELINIALRLRVNLLLLQPYLGLKWLFPGWKVSVPAFALPYEELLGCLSRIRQQRQWGADRVVLAS